MLEIFVSVLFLGFVVYRYFANPKWWRLIENAIIFIIASIYVATFVWDLGFPPSLIGIIVIVMSGTDSLWSWIILTLFIGALIPIVLYGVGWFLYEMFYNEDDSEDDIHVPIFVKTRSGWRVNW